MSLVTDNPNSAKASSPRGRVDLILLEMLQGRPEFQNVTRSQVQRMLREGWFFHQGEAIESKSRISADSEIEVRRPARPVQEPVGGGGAPLPILYEDEHLVVIDKPAGLVVHADAHHEDHVSARLQKQVGALSRLFEERPGIVHRLDKDTSGALVVAKSDRAHTGLAEMFAEHRLLREYRAFVYGCPGEATWTVENRLMRDPADRKRYTVVKGSAVRGKRAVSRFSVIEIFPFGVSVLSVRLETGRTHQVRIHATASGHSVLGDPVYGVPSSRQAKWVGLPAPIQALVKGLPGQALHAEVLEFVHPVSGATVSVRAPLPPHLEELSSALAALQRLEVLDHQVN